MDQDPLIIGSWKKGKLLDKGAFGCITLWHNTETQQTIALKNCLRTFSELTPKLSERWEQEVEILKKLDHPNVIKGLPVPEAFSVLNSPLPFLAMEYCSGGNLRKVLQKPENCCGLPEKDVRCILRDVSAGLFYLHTNHVVHRDLKPENVVLQEKDGKTVYKIIDLGYAKEFDQSSLCSSFVGTMQYLAPELFDKKPYTRAVDLWSLGILSYEVIVGQRPFSPAASPAQWIPLVHNKGTNHIRGDLTSHGEPAYSSTLPPACRLTRILREDLERWLQIVLETRPEMRGRRDGMTVYEILDSILSKQTVHIFNVQDLSVVSLSVREDCSSKELMSQKLFDAVKVTPESQLLLAENGAAVSVPKDIPQHSLCGQATGQVTLYLFNLLASGGSPKITYVPTTLQDLLSSLSDRGTQLRSAEIKKVWAASMFAVQKEVEKLYNILGAFHSVLAYLNSEMPAMQKALADVYFENNMLTAKMKFAHECYTTDLECMQHWSKENPNGGNQKVLENWATCDDLLTMVDKKRQSATTMCTQFNNICGRVSKFEKTPYAKTKQSDAWDEIIHRTMQTYSKAKHSRDFESISVSSQDMYTTIQDLLAEEGRLLADFNAYMKDMIKALRDTKHLQTRVPGLITEIVSVSRTISSIQAQRQHSIWNLIQKASLTQSVSTTTTKLQNSLAVEDAQQSLRERVEKELRDTKAKEESLLLCSKVEEATKLLEEECSTLLKDFESMPVPEVP